MVAPAGGASGVGRRGLGPRARCCCCLWLRRSWGARLAGRYGGTGGELVSFWDEVSDAGEERRDTILTR